MRLPIYYPGKWSSRAGRVLKFDRINTTPFCWCSIRYYEYQSYYALKALCISDTKLRKIIELFWFVLTQILIFIKKHPVYTILTLFLYYAFFFDTIKTHSYTANIVLIVLYTTNLYLVELWGYRAEIARKILDDIDYMWDKLPITKKSNSIDPNFFKDVN